MARRLAQSLLDPVPPTPAQTVYPAVPDPIDLIGFVTTGNYNLAEGRATSVGAISLDKVDEAPLNVKEREKRLCIVRNVGESVGRLARWDIVKEAW